MKPYSAHYYYTRNLLSSLIQLLALAFAFQDVCSALAIAVSSVGDEIITTATQLINGRDGLAKRLTVPSVPYIRQKIIAGGRMNNKVSIFWNGFQPPSDGYAAGRAYKRDVIGCERGVLYNEALPEPDWVYFQSVNENGQPVDNQYMEKIQVMSAVFAQTSSRNAYVLVEDGKVFAPASTWTLYEYPNLTAPGSAVTEIFLVSWPSQTQQSIWRRGDPQQGVWPPIGVPWDIFAV
ncbi:uncharacterized protein BP5553_00016 [Venustampulla echinocandica]|uniref:Uncharacterized protein n=1 Tax=Venustampulla echinocandica TaxID=2656787 RepID=A0A370TWY6_9HELO|nr:uncharacterized protein BP5553_00016 [Venustampulla echinocandica]RDL40037.1 hypothetical protein BP5553_00016 [Venustampulla echinocandica]